MSILNSTANEADNIKLTKRERLGIFLLELVAIPTTRDALIGDLIEARDAVREEYGERKAQIYFWWQVTRTAFPFVWPMIKRWKWVAIILGAFGWVASQFSR